MRVLSRESWTLKTISDSPGNIHLVYIDDRKDNHFEKHEIGVWVAVITVNDNLYTPSEKLPYNIDVVDLGSPPSSSIGK